MSNIPIYEILTEEECGAKCVYCGAKGTNANLKRCTWCGKISCLDCRKFQLCCFKENE